MKNTSDNTSRYEIHIPLTSSYISPWKVIDTIIPRISSNYPGVFISGQVSDGYVNGEYKRIFIIFVENDIFSENFKHDLRGISINLAGDFLNALEEKRFIIVSTPCTINYVSIE